MHGRFIIIYLRIDAFLYPLKLLKLIDKVLGLAIWWLFAIEMIVLIICDDLRLAEGEFITVINLIANPKITRFRYEPFRIFLIKLSSHRLKAFLISLFNERCQISGGLFILAVWYGLLLWIIAIVHVIIPWLIIQLNSIILKYNCFIDIYNHQVLSIFFHDWSGDLFRRQSRGTLIGYATGNHSQHLLPFASNSFLIPGLTPFLWLVGLFFEHVIAKLDLVGLAESGCLLLF